MALAMAMVKDENLNWLGGKMVRNRNFNIRIIKNPDENNVQYLIRFYKNIILQIKKQWYNIIDKPYVYDKVNENGY